MNNFIEKYAKIRGVDHVNTLQKEGQIAAQIKARRKALNMSQQDLANASGLPKSTVGRIEAGITSPNVSTLLKISQALNTPFIIDGMKHGDGSSASF
ncbi:MAG: helix-turn-helix domain-containing protein [Bacillus sp. (in: Bacteria)]|nr:helix-turn-helix domain-containing protein [Bacillus sp. (in: firmicutes)]